MYCNMQIIVKKILNYVLVESDKEFTLREIIEVFFFKGIFEI